jgi:hypothetical protein
MRGDVGGEALAVHVVEASRTSISGWAVMDELSRQRSRLGSRDCDCERWQARKVNEILRGEGCPAEMSLFETM